MRRIGLELIEEKRQSILNEEDVEPEVAGDRTHGRDLLSVLSMYRIISSTISGSHSYFSTLKHVQFARATDVSR